MPNSSGDEQLAAKGNLKIFCMKKIIFLTLALFVVLMAKAQLKAKPTCASFVVDILNGTVNSIKPDFPIPEIKEKLPCYSSAEDESASSKCGGGVFFKDKDIYFYTQRDYIEIGEKFKGQLSIPLLGASRTSLFKWLGNPKIKDANWDAFQMAYGTLVLHYNSANKVRLIQFSTKSTDELSLCE
jgi:hypothetical protein